VIEQATKLSPYELAWIAFLVAVTLACIAVFAFEGWVAFWKWHDDRMQNSKRIQNAQIDAAYKSGQLHVPYSQRDFK
jgi:hypothetical protein